MESASLFFCVCTHGHTLLSPFLVLNANPFNPLTLGQLKLSKLLSISTVRKIIKNPYLLYFSLSNFLSSQSYK